MNNKLLCLLSDIIFSPRYTIVAIKVALYPGSWGEEKSESLCVYKAGQH